jgi:hypothetical protein
LERNKDKIRGQVIINDWAHLDLVNTESPIDSVIDTISLPKVFRFFFHDVPENQGCRGLA